MERSLHFIEHIIEEDLTQDYKRDQLRFRFPRNLMVIYT